jgi:VWFA-related protein
MRRLLKIAVCGAALASLAWAQAGRRFEGVRTTAAQLVNVTAKRAADKSDPIGLGQISLYDAGFEQSIKSFTPDPGPAHIVLLVDNSTTIRADDEKLMQAAREFAYEIYQGDKLMVVAYNEQATIMSDWTDNAKNIETAVASFTKKGDPALFDALHAVLADALDPLAGTTKKRVVVVVSDGLDRGSKTKFDAILAALQNDDITVYALQAPDRTGGAYRRDRPKPTTVLEKLVTGTGGLAFPLADPATAAKTICDELRNNRYLLAYQPEKVPFGEARSLLVAANEGITVRAKTAQPVKN